MKTSAGRKRISWKLLFAIWVWYFDHAFGFAFPREGHIQGIKWYFVLCDQCGTQAVGINVPGMKHSNISLKSVARSRIWSKLVHESHHFATVVPSSLYAPTAGSMGKPHAMHVNPVIQQVIQHTYFVLHILYCCSPIWYSSWLRQLPRVYS